MRPPSEVLASIGRPRIVVVGDLILDRYVEGSVERISPEAPVQVLRVESDETRLGGAGSVAHNLAVLGADVVLVGVLGADEPGRRFAERAAAAGVRLSAPTDPARPTSVKTRHLARSHSLSQQLLRVDDERTEPVEGALEAAVAETVAAELGRADAAIVSDYAKGLLTDGILARLFAWSGETGKPVVVDPKREGFEGYRGATGITPNRPETAMATGLRVKTVADAERAAERLVGHLDLEFALVTLDRDGMVLKDRAGPPHHFPSTPREVFDVTGAGDMVISVLGLVLASGGTPAEGAALANVAAGIEVEHVGVVPIPRSEIAARLAAEGGTVAKSLDRAGAAAAARALRTAGKRVVFTNGCFDVLHAGHARFLAAARRLGDALFVGLNSDASVRRLKGAGRPVHSEDDRVEVLAALAAVDHVVVFPEDDPVALLQAIRPDVLVKGEDWKEKGVLGRDLVEGYGGKVVLVPLLEGRSTTGTLERLAGPAKTSKPAKPAKRAPAKRGARRS
jgi:D-beta-D-heptose 7-phosphate kinase/D-beta-D-heptose 1-phosphate adenosyltransferase